MSSQASHERLALIGSSPSICALRDDVECAARSDGKVLITGESGSGKEIVARLIHAHGPRSRVPLIMLNCSGLPETLLESELFGHTRGSFTGAYRDKAGILEQGNRGTVFLDEIGETSLRMQSMLLRFLETGEIQRVGSTRNETPLDVRIIAATNRDLTALIAEKTFRQDLYYRLNVIHLIVPPLRHHREDIPELVQSLGHRLAEHYGVPAPVPTAEAMRRLMWYNWPGNVRELRNVLERTIARRGGGEIGVQDLPIELQEPQNAPAAAVAQAPVAVNHVDKLCERMLKNGETFWTAVYPSFIARDLTRETLQAVVARGLEQTRGNYRMLIELFNMPPDDYKRFLNFLRKHQSHVPFQRFRGTLTKMENVGDRSSSSVPPRETAADA